MTEESTYILITNLSLKDYTKVSKDISKLEEENQKLKKQKYDVIEYIKTTKLIDYDNDEVDMLKDTYIGEDLLRMLGEEK